MTKKKNSKVVVDKKQPTLASFDFRKRTLHRREMVEVDIPKFATTDLGTYECTSCPKKIKNSQGISVHLICVHSDVILNKILNAILNEIL